MKKEPWLAALLAIYPGAGHFYLARPMAGGIIAALFLAAMSVSVVTWVQPDGNAVVSVAAAVAALLIQLFSVIDAFRSARRRNDPAWEAARRSQRDPWLAAFLSFIIPGLGHLYLRKWPIAILVFGFNVVLALTIAFLTKDNPDARLPWTAMGIGSFLAVWSATRVQESTADRTRHAGMIIAPLVIVSTLAVWGVRYVRDCYVQSFHISANSMAPTLLDGDLVVVEKCDKTLRRGDLVVFISPETGGAYVKRLVALPRETVSINRDGRLVIDDQVVETPPFDQLRYAPQGHYGVNGDQFYVPVRQFFVLGDNSERSLDSRMFGSVSEDAYIGRLYKIWWPLSRAAPVN